MSNTLSTRDQLARDLYVHNQGETPRSAFETADAFMAEVARRAPRAPRQRTAVPVRMVECPGCGGSGDGPDRCDGAGEVSQDACPTCDGKGLTPAPVAAVADTARTEVISAGTAAPASAFSLAEHLRHQHEWSECTFGPGPRTAGVIDHIRKELGEIEAQPSDLEEWIDVVILALDGACRSGASPAQIIETLAAKQAKNEARVWPDWRTAAPGKAIEHERCTDWCTGTCTDHPGTHARRASQHAETAPCCEWRCDGTGPAHTAQSKRPEVPATVAPVVLTSDERAAVGCINREFWWGDALCTLLKRLGVEVKL